MKQNYTTAPFVAASIFVGPVAAQDTASPADEPILDDIATADEVAPEEVQEGTLQTDNVEAVTADALVEEEAVEEAVEEATIVDDAVVATASEADDATSDIEAPDLAEIAASDPALDVRTDADGEVDGMIMLSNVLFEYGDATLAPDAITVLQGLAPKLEGAKALEITGHTDARGDEAYNLDLSLRRAEAVRGWLIANSALTDETVTARGLGETEPAAANQTDDGSDDPEGRALNRRVELTLPDES